MVPEAVAVWAGVRTLQAALSVAVVVAVELQPALRALVGPHQTVRTELAHRAFITPLMVVQAALRVQILTTVEPSIFPSSADTYQEAAAAVERTMTCSALCFTVVAVAVGHLAHKAQTSAIKGTAVVAVGVAA